MKAQFFVRYVLVITVSIYMANFSTRFTYIFKFTYILNNIAKESTG